MRGYPLHVGHAEVALRTVQKLVARVPPFPLPWGAFTENWAAPPGMVLFRWSDVVAADHASPGPLATD